LNTEEALIDLGVESSDLTDEQSRQLDERGYFIVENYFDEGAINRLRSEYDRWAPTATTVEFTGQDADKGTTAVIEAHSVFLLDLFNKSDVFDSLLTVKPMLVAARRLLGEFKVFSLNGRAPAKGKGQQGLHSDAPRLHDRDWRMVNTLISIDEMTADNGATRLIPGSHKWPPLNVPLENIGDVTFPLLTEEELALLPEDPMAEHPDEIRVHLAPGSLAVLNAHLWHGGTANSSGDSRRLFHMALCRRDTPQEYSQRDCLTQDLWDRSTPAQRFLLDIEVAR
jgi:ectoine hydroxylase-related dioxygenase (phytanoyl-CoA dioxygenase family)